MPKSLLANLGALAFPSPSSISTIFDRELSPLQSLLAGVKLAIAKVLEAKLAKVRQLKQGMMQELLTGRIRLI